MIYHSSLSHQSLISIHNFKIVSNGIIFFVNTLTNSKIKSLMLLFSPGDMWTNTLQLLKNWIGNVKRTNHLITQVEAMEGETESTFHCLYLHRRCFICWVLLTVFCLSHVFFLSIILIPILCDTKKSILQSKIIQKYALMINVKMIWMFWKHFKAIEQLLQCGNCCKFEISGQLICTTFSQNHNGIMLNITLIILIEEELFIGYCNRRTPQLCFNVAVSCFMYTWEGSQ